MALTTVLYVEDDDNDAYFMQRCFQKLGFEHCLRVVTDGQQAIEYLSGSGKFQDRSQHPLPTIIVLDINLPLLSGFDVLKWIRRQTHTQSVPVYIFSSSARPEEKVQACDLGATEYIQKPSSGLEFSALAEKICGQWMSGKVTPGLKAGARKDAPKEVGGV
jgi:CheY-like chemotaxis protein